MLKQNRIAVKDSNIGSASILVILVMVLLLCMGRAILPVLRSEKEISREFRNGVTAQYLAEAGAQRAIYELNKNILWAGIPYSGEELNNDICVGRYSVEVISAGSPSDIVWVRSIGTAYNAERIVSFAYVWPPESNAYEYTLFSGDNLTIVDSNSIQGITVGSCKQTRVAGNIIAALSNLIDITIPVLNCGGYQISPYRLPTSAEINKGVGLSGLVYYYESSQEVPFEIEKYKTLAGNGVIYCKNSIIVDEGVKLSGHVSLISERSIIIGRGSVLTKALLIARQNIDIKENVSFSGIAVAGGLMSIGSGTVIKRNDSVVTRIQTNYTYN